MPALSLGFLGEVEAFFVYNCSTWMLRQVLRAEF